MRNQQVNKISVAKTEILITRLAAWLPSCDRCDHCDRCVICDLRLCEHDEAWHARRICILHTSLRSSLDYACIYIFIYIDNKSGERLRSAKFDGGGSNRCHIWPKTCCRLF